MRDFTRSPIVLGLALAMLLVGVLQPTPHSLSYGSALLALIALLGWTLEAREVAGLALAVEPEEEVEEPPAGPSYWPLVLAFSIAGIAAGFVYEWPYGIFLVAAPVAVASTAMWLAAMQREVAALEVAAETPEGRVRPVPASVLAAQRAAGAALAIERVPPSAIPRRGLLGLVFWTGLGTSFAANTGVLFDLLWPRGIKGFGGSVVAGTVDQFPPESMTQVREGRFWLVNLTEEQGGPGFLALWWKCPHLGCTVPWRSDFRFVNPFSGQETQGWFRCPCHGSTYTHAGVRVYGPAPRSLDRMELTIDPSSKRIVVNTGKIAKGTPDNASFAVKV